MATDFKTQSPPIIKEYLNYLQTIQGKSKKTITEYFIDLRTFFRFIKVKRGLVSEDTEFSQIEILDVDLEIIKSVTLTDAYEFMSFLLNERDNNNSTRARKTTCLRQFYKYLTVKKHYLDDNPIKELESPKKRQSLPKYLTLEQSIELLEAVDGPNKERDYAIITLFLNCGLRLSEVVGLNFSDIRTDNTMRILGKGNKERVVYLNSSCVEAINAYKKVRPVDGLKDKNALFISRNHRRMSPKTVQAMVYKYLEKIGLDAQGYSCHKLRHTAATLMYQHGNVDIRVLKEILGHENLSTTEIYTHISSEQMKNAADLNPLSKVKKRKKSSDT